ncbi:MAG: hypothetical protein D6786_06815 [Gammaproteobacteria bacterium]|nr:MAG: hypothetical protein D6786_06815 [Gammaproteobacteria bacterium]
MLHGIATSTSQPPVADTLPRTAHERSAAGGATRRSGGRAGIVIEQEAVTRQGVAGEGRRAIHDPEELYLARMRQRFPGGERMLARDLLASLIREMSGEVTADVRGTYIDRYL